MVPFKKKKKGQKLLLSREIQRLHNDFLAGFWEPCGLTLV